MKSQPLFTETQRMHQWWVWVVLLGLLGIAAAGLYTQLYLGRPFGQHPMSNAGLVAFAVLVAGLAVLLLSATLRTELSQEGIAFSHLYIIKKFVPWSSVQQAEVVKYSGTGVGIRLSATYGTVYNMNVGYGLAVQLKNGKRFLLGTQKPEEMKAFLAAPDKE